jgi:hypothetical protein
VEVPVVPLQSKHSNHDGESRLSQTYQGETLDVVPEMQYIGYHWN